MAKGKIFKEYYQKALGWCKANLPSIKGFVLIASGILLMCLAYMVIIYLLEFALGLILVYYGFKELKIKQVTNFMDNIFSKFRK